MSNLTDVYTFFDPISGWNSDKKLLELWVKNWSMAGFNPIVLRKKDAELNPNYESFVEKISSGFKNITGHNIIDDNPWSFYVYNNYIRFLSYAKVLSKSGLSPDRTCPSRESFCHAPVLPIFIFHLNYIVIFNLESASNKIIYILKPILLYIYYGRKLQNSIHIL